MSASKIVAGVAVWQIGLAQHTVLIKQGSLIGLLKMSGGRIDQPLLNRGQGIARFNLAHELRSDDFPDSGQILFAFPHN